MAQRRMVSKEIHQNGKFLSLTPTSKILYDDLVLYADDDGFCNDIDLINLMDKATDENYKELEDAGFLAKVENHYLIVDWLNTQVLNHYSRTSLLDLSSKVFIKLDFKYTVDPQNKNIAISLDDWIEKEERNRKIDLKSLRQQRLNNVTQKVTDGNHMVTEGNQLGNKKVTGGNHNVTKTVTEGLPGTDTSNHQKSPHLLQPQGISDKENKKVTDGNHMVTQKVPKGSPSIGKYSIDKSSIEQDQQRAEKATNYKYINSSSNGGMGETLTTAAPTSSLENNATKESGEDSGVKAGVNNSSSLDSKEANSNNTPINANSNTPLTDNQSTVNPSKDAKDLFNYLNTVFNIHMPSDERLLVLFEDLSNQYQQQYIKQGIDQLADSLGSDRNSWDYRTVKNMILSHLANTIKAVIKQ